MAWLLEIGLEFVDILVKSGDEPALTKLDRVMQHAESDEEWIEDDHREQSSEKFEEQGELGESHLVGAGNDQNSTQFDRGEVGDEH